MNKKRSYNMKSKLLKFFLNLSLALVFIMGSAFAEGGDKGQKGNTLNKPLGTPIRAYMNINFISTIIKNDAARMPVMLTSFRYLSKLTVWPSFTQIR